MFRFHVGIRPWFNPTHLYLPPQVSLWQTQARNSSSGLNKAREARFQDTSARQIVDDGGETVSKSVNKTTQLLKIKHCILIMSLITIPPPPLLPPFSFPPGSMTRQESPSTLLHYGEHWWPLDRQPKTILQHHQHHSTNTTTNITTTPPKPWSRKGRKQHKQLQHSTSWRQQGTTTTPQSLSQCVGFRGCIFIAFIIMYYVFNVFPLVDAHLELRTVVFS